MRIVPSKTTGLRRKDGYGDPVNLFHFLSILLLLTPAFLPKITPYRFHLKTKSSMTHLTLKMSPLKQRMRVKTSKILQETDSTVLPLIVVNFKC